MTVDPIIAIQGWVPVIGLFVTLFAALAPSIYNGWRADRSAKRAVIAAEVVARQLADSDIRTAQKLDVIHNLVDSRLESALQKIDRLEQRLLDNESEPPDESTA